MIDKSPLGKQVASYDTKYNPDLLFAIARSDSRGGIGITDTDLPFNGWDMWNCYEFCWLSEQCVPNLAILEIIVPASTRFIVESKSLKLYLNSFSNSKFKNHKQVIQILENDIRSLLKSDDVQIVYRDLMLCDPQIKQMDSKNIDSNLRFIKFDMEASLNKNMLSASPAEQIVDEGFHTNILKSNCPVTNQPDWASVQVKYRAQKKLNLDNFLRYIFAFREHNEFHEACAERIFMDISEMLQPEFLEIYCRFTRRGGIDINPIRTTDGAAPVPYNFRTPRQ